MLTKNSNPSRIYRLLELEKIAENIDRLGGLCKNVFESIRIKKRKEIGDKNELANPPKLINPSSHSFSKFKVVNRFKVNKGEQTDQTRTPKYKNEQHGRAQKSYQIIIDAKYVKMLVKRSYRAENLYDFFRNLYQMMNAILLEFELIPSNDREKFDTHLIQRRLNLSQFGLRSMNKHLLISKHGN